MPRETLLSLHLRRKSMEQFSSSGRKIVGLIAKPGFRQNAKLRSYSKRKEDKWFFLAIAALIVTIVAVNKSNCNRNHISRPIKKKISWSNWGGKPEQPNNKNQTKTTPNTTTQNKKQNSKEDQETYLGTTHDEPFKLPFSETFSSSM